MKLPLICFDIETYSPSGFVVNNYDHLDVYRLVRQTKSGLPRYTQKMVEQCFGIERIVDNVSGVSYCRSFYGFQRDADLKALFYNVEDSIGCLRIMEKMESENREDNFFMKFGIK